MREPQKIIPDSLARSYNPVPAGSSKNYSVTQEESLFAQQLANLKNSELSSALPSDAK